MPGTTPDDPGPSARATRFLLLGVLALAFLLRAVYVLQSRASPYFAEPQMDALYHLEWARAVAAGQDFQPGPFFRAPLYPWFLGLLLRAFGEDLLLARMVQAAIGTASVALVHAIGARAFDRRVGLLGALFAAAYWILIYFDGELLLPVLEVFLDLSAILLSLRFSERATPGRAGLAGLAFGAAAIARPNVLLFAPFVLAWILFLRGPAARARLLAAAAFVGLLLAPIAPLAIYNRAVGGDLVLISSQGGLNWWIGNNPRADGSAAIVPGARADWWGGYHDSIRMAEAEAGRPLRPSEVSRHYARKAFDWMRAEPGRALLLWAWKLRLFWTDWELGNNSSESFFALRFGPVLRRLPLGFGALAPLALVGLALSIRRARALLPLWGFVPVYTSSVVAFFVCSRFRVPVLPVLCVFAAHACVKAMEAARARRFGALAAGALATLLLALGVGRVPAAIDRSDSSGLWELGNVEARGGNWAAAESLYRASLAERPRNRFALRDLGTALGRLGRASEAEESLASALRLDPCDVAALGALVEVRIRDGRAAQARAAAEKAVACAPVDAAARYDLGRSTLADAGIVDATARRERALAAFRAGLDLASDESTAFNCAFGAATALAELGRHREAVLACERALEIRPEPDAEGWWFACQRRLREELAADGREDEARRRGEELRARFPDEPRAR